MMRWKIVKESAAVAVGKTTNWSLGYPTKKAALAAARRLNQTSPSRFSVEKMTAEDEALASSLERGQE